MRRIAALVVAIGLIVGAVIIRNHRDTEKARGPYRLTCATEFATACATLPTTEVAVTIEPAGVTADRLIALPPGADPGLDGWLAAGAWPYIVGQARRAAGLGTFTNATIDVGAHTRLVVVGWRDRLVVLRKACNGNVTWECIGDAAFKQTWKANGGPETWGPVKIALPDPVTETPGLAALAVAALHGLPDPVNNDAYLRWLAAIAKASTRPAPDLAAILSSGPALADLYVGVEAEVSPAVQSSVRRSELEVITVSTPTDIDAQLLAFRRDPPNNLGAAVRATGWTRYATGLTKLPLNITPALRQLWKDTVR